MTGRQFARIGVPGVFMPSINVGLPLNETTVAAQLKKASYATAAIGKWVREHERACYCGAAVLQT
jgi:arylsulfatase A-like enzyme